MTTAIGGGDWGGAPQKQTRVMIIDKLRECESDKGERVQKSNNFADVI